MKLKEYVKNLNELIEKYPDALDFDVCFSVDKEGNYNPVEAKPTVGYWDYNDEVIPESYLDEYMEYQEVQIRPDLNLVILN